ncbi:FAS-associated factor 2 [Condylostylus longicornis]|uniref:FAS-associated factor 2 n=1 Tax=Condylostylus longicornis TaxID=2530218 RepID=UPI00244E4DDD|nr:FAS-associated factor 2 [Condylostylus longicornis]
MEADNGLTSEQTDTVLQFQDVTGIEDINICRDILIRHQWDLEVAIQEQLNIREGRPSMYAANTDIRAPQVVNDRFLQHVFSAQSGLPGFSNGSPIPNSFTGFLGYIVNCVFQFCYSTVSSVISVFFKAIFGGRERIVTDPLGDVMKFIQTYNEKYPDHAVFYQGTYAQALNDAKHEIRFLLVYLHSETNQTGTEVQRFCNETLSNRDVIEYINRNMLFWGCDVSSPEGYRVSHSINAKTYPLLVLVGLRSNKMIIMGRMEGYCSPEELLRRLRVVVNDNEVWLTQARVERLERNLTQTLRQQQDEAYELSLKADQEKERRKEQEKEECRKAQEAEEARIRAEQEKKDEIARLKIELATRVPSEPPKDSPDAIHVVFKLPNGARIERRFLNTDSLIDVYYYIFCHPSSPDTFEITTNFPKRVLYTKESTQNYQKQSLHEAGLKNREVLFVNDLDA